MNDNADLVFIYLVMERIQYTSKYYNNCPKTYSYEYSITG